MGVTADETPATADHVPTGAATAGRARPTTAGYARSTGTRRGQARREQLLALVTDDLGRNGLVDFSLRRAARAAGTTHKVLLYHFDGVEDLLLQGVLQLRGRRIDNGLAAATGLTGSDRLADRVRALWPILTGPESWVLDQVMGLAMFDQARYARLADDATQRYIPALVSICPPDWPEPRSRELAHMILATLRGFLIELRTGHDTEAIEAGFAALTRVLDREQDA